MGTAHQQVVTRPQGGLFIKTLALWDRGLGVHSITGRHQYRIVLLIIICKTALWVNKEL